MRLVTSSGFEYAGIGRAAQSLRPWRDTDTGERTKLGDTELDLLWKSQFVDRRVKAFEDPCVGARDEHHVVVPPGVSRRPHLLDHVRLRDDALALEVATALR